MKSDAMNNGCNSEFRVSLRGGFADRMGLNPENTTLQIHDLDTRTRTQLINTITDMIESNLAFSLDNDNKQRLIKSVYANVYQKEIKNTAFYDEREFLEIIKRTIRTEDYAAVLTLLEYICQRLPSVSPGRNPFNRMNQLFKKEYVGYRFVKGIIVPITDENEIRTIEEATNGLTDEASIHIRKALGLLSDRDKPDYENSIKESISAVEALCVQLDGNGKTLGKVLGDLQKKIPIHPRLKEAFDKLYAYTCDGKGIRHAGNIGGPDSTFAEAQFMLVSCSAFVNYLRCISAD